METSGGGCGNAGCMEPLHVYTFKTLPDVMASSFLFFFSLRFTLVFSLRSVEEEEQDVLCVFLRI